MKSKKSGRPILYSFCFTLLILVGATAASLNVAADATSTVVSPALHVLAEENSMAMAGLVGKEIAFDRDDFARAVNLSRVSSITVTHVPALTDGELRIGSTVVTSGQTISGSSLDLLTYTPKASGITTSSFRFRVGDSPLDLTCHLYLLARANACPTLQMTPETALDVSTHRNITLYGTLPCYDPEGDETRIEIVSYPTSGILILTDPSTGDYTFTPTVGYAGKDQFTYVARDKYGNYSASATVHLTVKKSATATTYADMADSPAYSAALTMTEEGIMSGTQVGSNTYFYPDRTVSRGEFVVMAMHAMGMTEPAPVSKTVFADDSDIPSHMKSYIATAYELGFVKGEKNQQGQLCFYPNRTVTRAEAAVILSGMLNAPTPTVTPLFSDAAEIPTWAAPSFYSLHALGVMETSRGEISPTASLTRGETARMLETVLRLQN